MFGDWFCPAALFFSSLHPLTPSSSTFPFSVRYEESLLIFWSLRNETLAALEPDSISGDVRVRSVSLRRISQRLEGESPSRAARSLRHGGR